jgi:hypothetical protein
MALMAGFQLHLPKPVEGRVLTQALAALAGPDAAPARAAAGVH